MSFMQSDIKDGFISGLPIALGYFFTAVGLGVYAVLHNIEVSSAVALSLTGLSSTGSLVGLRIIADCGTFAEMAIAQFIVNIRYSLLSVSLSQKISSFPVWEKVIMAFGNTDEIFAVAMNRKGLTAKFFFALMILPILGWTSGTWFGMLFGNFLPEKIKASLGILIYSMLIAIVTPVAKKKFSYFFTCVSAVLLSSFIFYKLPAVTSGFSVIITSVIVSVIAAFLFPVKEEEL